MSGELRPRAADLVREWANLGAALAIDQAQHMRSAGKSLRSIADAGETYATRRRAHLRGVLRYWEDQFSPVEDPLGVNFGLNRWLAGSREEAYSDWLSWLLQEFRCSRFVGRLLFGDCVAEAEQLLTSPSYSVDREVWVPEGHKGRAGRLDCVLRFECGIIVLELKKTEAEQADTAKHEGYLSWLDRQPQALKMGILIATSIKDQEQYDGFHLLQWETLCRRARHLLLELRKTNRLAFVSTACALVGAIEQNILGLPSVSSLGTYQEITSQDMERVIEYLK